MIEINFYPWFDHKKFTLTLLNKFNSMQKNLLFALYFNLNFNLTNFFGFGINVNGITVASVFGGCKLPLDTYSQSDGCLNMG